MSSTSSVFAVILTASGLHFSYISWFLHDSDLNTFHAALAVISLFRKMYYPAVLCSSCGIDFKYSIFLLVSITFGACKIQVVG